MLAERPSTYASPNILARRARLLALTRELIAEQGHARFSMKEVGLRAGVAKQTVYNIFQTRERMIATAISDYFEENEDRIVYRSVPATMERMIERVVVAGARAQKLRNYLSALMAIYFAPDADPAIQQAIHRVGAYPHAAWIEALARGGALLPWADPAALTDDIAHLGYVHLLEWCRGRLSDEESLRRKVVGALSLVSGAVRPAPRAAIEARIAEIAGQGLPDYGPTEDLRASDAMRAPPAAHG